MYCTTVERKKLIEAFLMHEINYTVGDVPKIMFKVWFVAGPSLKVHLNWAQMRNAVPLTPIHPIFRGR